jgi:hypothetical protein
MLGDGVMQQILLKIGFRVGVFESSDLLENSKTP